eukprot:Skav208232  [mRNA]  locus=scaffold2601:146585:147265:+ [translate_table: standard]
MAGFHMFPWLFMVNQSWFPHVSQLGQLEESEHSFRCFDFAGKVLRIREEISSENMPTGGRLWDAGSLSQLADVSGWFVAKDVLRLAERRLASCVKGIVLAHWLVARDNPHRRAILGASNILELGSGCGLLGIVAALGSAAEARCLVKSLMVGGWVVADGGLVVV